MESIKEIYKIGNGPSSSHTMGPLYATKRFIDFFKKNNIKFDKIRVTLYSSLAWTGKGHLTDKIIKETLKDYNCEIVFDYKTLTEHPNTLKFDLLLKDKIVSSKTYISIGGGYIKENGVEEDKIPDVYQFSKFELFKQYIQNNDIVGFIDSVEDESLNDYLSGVVDAMCNSVEKGLNASGTVAFELEVKRVAKDIFEEAQKEKDESVRRTLFLTSYAYAASEENASGGVIVTAPTAGSCGVLASLVHYYLHNLKIDKKRIIDALRVSGIIGLIIKNEASISGSVAGCQAEIGSASSMGAAFLCAIDNMSLNQIGYASEVALEHSLGLTCDPVHGYVAIPCIERNAMGVLRAYDSYLYAKYISKYRDAYVKFDDVVKVMRETGMKMNEDLKETSRAGLAKINKEV